MIYSIQSYLEDYFNRCGLADADRYAVSLARVYDRQRHGKTATRFLSLMRGMHTSFYKQNPALRRQLFERKILTLLDGKFKKKEFYSSHRPSHKALKLHV